MDNTDLSIVALTLLNGMAAASVSFKRPKKRKHWIKQWVNRRDEWGIMKLVNNELQFEDPEAFKNYIRMTKESFMNLLGRVEPYISKADTNMRQCISSRDKLMTTLRFLATGESYRNLMYSTRIHESTISLFVPEVCKAIYLVLKDDYMKIPQKAEDWENIASEYLKHWQVPNTIGALDGKHIAFRAPRSAGSTYYNYKGYNSIVLLALVDANYRFIYIDVGVNGRISDGGVFAQSDLYRCLENKKINIPPDRPLPGCEKPTPYVILADAAFPLKTYIMKPYPFRGLTHDQAIFNYRLSRGRRLVENAFGILANRFRIFLTTINLDADKVTILTMACCALHNFLTDVSILNLNIEEEVLATNRSIGQQKGNHSSGRAIDVRQEFLQYFIGPGKVDWQERML